MPDRLNLILDRLAHLAETLEVVATNSTIQAKRLETLLNKVRQLDEHVTDLTEGR